MPTSAKAPDGEKKKRKLSKDGLVLLPDGRFRIRVYLYGTKGTRETPAPRKSITLPRGWTRNQALAYLSAEKSKAAALRGKPFLKRFTVRDAYEEMTVYYSKASVAENTVLSVVRAGKHLLPLLGDRRLTDLRAGDVEAYQRQRREGKAAPATVNGEVTWLRAALKRAVRARWIDSDPLPAGSIKRVPGEAVVAAPLTAMEWASFRDAIDDDGAWLIHESRSTVRFPPKYRERLRGAAVASRALLLLGGRIGEVIALTWSKVNFETGCVDVHQAKVRQPKPLPMTPTVRAILESLPRGTPGARVFVRADTGRPWTRDTLTTAFKVLVQIAGLRRDIGPHTLRHTATTWLTAEGVPEALVADITGHAPRTMTARYIINADATILETLLKLESVENRVRAPIGHQSNPAASPFRAANTGT